jgi:hypothetical protein
MDGSRNSSLLWFLLALLAFCPASSWADPGKTKQKPTGLKRPTFNRPIPADKRIGRAEPTTIAASGESGITAQAAGSTYSNTPPLSANFEALLSDGTAFSPETYGAVGPNHLMVALNTEVRIQTRSGAEVSRMSLGAWWAQTLTGISNVFDPRVVYDNYRGRWIFSANNDPVGPNASLLLAVSASSDPTGTWFRRSIALPTTSVFADLPMVGFNTNWIVLAADTYNETTFDFVSAEVYVFNKNNLYSNGTLAPTRFSTTEIASLVPVVTYDPTNGINYLVSVWNPNDQDPVEPSGHLVIYSISGTLVAPVFSLESFPYTEPWADTPPVLNLGPQAGTPNRVSLGDSRIRSATFRGGTIQAAHTIFLPPGTNATYSAVQWWEFTTSATFHLGRIESGATAAISAATSSNECTGRPRLIGPVSPMPNVPK